MNHQIKTAALSTIALSLLGCNQAQPQVEEPSASRPVQVIEVNERNEELNKSFSGIVKAKETASLSFRVPGTVESVFVNKGSVVEKGQVIATLDKHDYQVSLEELQARMLEAQSAHKLAKAELKRVKQATSDDAIASVNLDRAISSYNVASLPSKWLRKTSNVQKMPYVTPLYVHHSLALLPTFLLIHMSKPCRAAVLCQFSKKTAGKWTSTCRKI